MDPELIDTMVVAAWATIFFMAIYLSWVSPGDRLRAAEERIRQLENRVRELKREEDIKDFWDRAKERRQKEYDDHQKAVERIRKLREQNKSDKKSQQVQTYATHIYKKPPADHWQKLVGVFSTKELADEAGRKAVEKKGDSFWYTVTNKRLDHYEDTLV